MAFAASLLAALCLSALPLPAAIAPAWPMWVALVLIYWCIALPEQVGVWTAWLLGLVLDVYEGALFGQNALALALTAFVLQHVYRNFRFYPPVQQALLVGVLLFMQLGVLLLVRVMTGQPPSGLTYWLPACSSVLLWPWVFVILRDLRRRARHAA